ncbi:phage protein [Acetobacter pasteurianus NBRC 3280]|uniref:Phage protein n=1 Tax=Acetobacter pasteurianus NBRC 3278 TaxID=1226660 RepID=A0A401X881_ACEPA|nr:hypothetical protein [Acetobacter pasteurianus]GCD60343.1 phage protein [Acetobacter pasteurianus NBRC 3277]GCD63898.1 phage protein [Acetobacter pasteurianus NBRC 3278]GCD70343.1 phage protein [Acetobacter pasteurianus NBRC 3280]
MTVEIFGIERAGHIINAARKRAMAGSIEVGWDNRERYTDGTSVGMVALIQEFGTVRVTKDGRQWIPPRPFMRQCVEKNKAKWAQVFMKRIEEGNAQMDAAKSVRALMASDLRAAIIAFDDPQNMPSTIQRKGFNDPLVDTGLMLRSISSSITAAPIHASTPNPQPEPVVEDTPPPKPKGLWGRVVNAAKRIFGFGKK